MKKQAVLDHFGGVSSVAKKLGITPASVSQWPDPIPMGRAYQLDKLTKGKLRFNPELYNKTNYAA